MAQHVIKLTTEIEQPKETATEPSHVDSHRLVRLAEKMHDKEYRDGYVAAHTRQVLAKQMREFRGDTSQIDFAATLDKRQTMVSRLENPNYTGWTLNTLFEVASKLNVAVFVRFVDFSTFLKYSGEQSEPALHPASYEQDSVDDFARLEVWQETTQDKGLAQDLYTDLLSGSDLLSGHNNILSYNNLLNAPNLFGEWHETKISLPAFRPAQISPLSGGYLAYVDSQAIALQKELDKKDKAIKKLEAENKRIRAENAQLREALAPRMPTVPGYAYSYPTDSENVISLGVQNPLPPPWQIPQIGQ
jgi:hypothetical protein